MSKLFAVITLVCLVSVIGCGDKIQPRDIEIKPPASALEPVLAQLELYAKGQALGSEVTAFPDMITAVKQENPAKGDIVEKGLNDIAKSKGDVSKKAKDLLAKLKD
jgi:hypothetical protein